MRNSGKVNNYEWIVSANSRERRNWFILKTRYIAYYWKMKVDTIDSCKKRYSISELTVSISYRFQ